jgi:hypothetical protein
MISFDRIRDIVLLRNLAPRDRRAVLRGLAVLAPALFYLGAVRPYRAAMTELRDRIASERALLEREEALVAGKQTLPANAASMQDRAERASMRLVRAANVPLAEAEVTGFLQDIAGLSRVLLQSMSGVEPRRGEKFEIKSVRPLRLSVRGESDLEGVLTFLQRGVLTFLQRVENSPLLMRVAELSIEPQTAGRGEDRTTTGVVQFTMIVEAYAPSDVERTEPREEVSL